MAEADQASEPIAGTSYTYVVVIILLGLALGLGFLIGAHQSGQLNSKLENAWLASQDPDNAPSGPPLDDSTTISIARGGYCEGACPAYSVTIYGSGRVEYDGRRDTCEVGTRSATIEPTLVRKLSDGLNLIPVGSFPNYIDEDWTDAPTTHIRYVYGGNTYSIEHYHGDEDAPRLLRWVENRIDEVAGSERWIGSRSTGFELRRCRQQDPALRPVANK